MSFLPALVSFDEIDRADLNRCLIEWGHKMGPWTRPVGFPEWFHGMRHNGELVAVLAAAALIREKAAGFSRVQAIELGRVCAARPALNRAAVRIWREFIFPALCAAHGYEWVISYQDAVEHTGGLYRFDGWIKLGFSSSGTDPRGQRSGRRKVIWGFSHNTDLMVARIRGDTPRYAIEAAA
jgi:hypothetical protein